MLNKKWRCFLKLVHDQSKAANLSTKISDCRFPVSVRCRVLLRRRHRRQRPTGRTTSGQIFRGFADVQFEGVFLLFGSAASQWRPTPDHNLKKLYRFAIQILYVERINGNYQVMQVSSDKVAMQTCKMFHSSSATKHELPLLHSFDECLLYKMSYFTTFSNVMQF